MYTKGRKSSTKKWVIFHIRVMGLTSRKTKETGEVDEDGNPILLSDVEKEGDAELGDEATLEGRVQSPKQEIKEELQEIEAETPKRKLATKAKGKAGKSVAEADSQDVDVKPEVAQEAVNEGGESVDATVEVNGKPPPKKRARKSKDEPKA
jgi:hypothetical protein